MSTAGNKLKRELILEKAKKEGILELKGLSTPELRKLCCQLLGMKASSQKQKAVKGKNSKKGQKNAEASSLDNITAKVNMEAIPHISTLILKGPFYPNIHKLLTILFKKLKDIFAEKNKESVENRAFLE